MLKNQMAVNMGTRGQSPTEDAESWQELKGGSGHPQNALEAKATFEKIETRSHKTKVRNTGICKYFRHTERRK